MIFPSGHHLPTAGAMNRSFELNLMNFASIVKINVERREVYAQIDFADGSHRLYTLPVREFLDTDQEPTHIVEDAVYVLTGLPPAQGAHDYATRYGTSLIAIIPREHH